MRILLASCHRYPAFGAKGSGRQPTRYPSGSGYHIHDLLARGLVQEGHEVLYYLQGGSEADLPLGIRQVAMPLPDANIYHAPIAVQGFAPMIQESARSRGRACLFTCHMEEPGASAGSHWLFVSRNLARRYGSERVVLNGVDPEDLVFSESKDDYLLFMSAMDRPHEKGLDRALALAKWAGRRLIVAGTARCHETVVQVADACADFGAEYLGDVRGREKAELIAGASALLFPSRLPEGCPLIILEAMFSGTPVLSSPNGGAREIVTPDTGFICNQDDEWLRALGRLDEVSPAGCRAIADERFHYRRMVIDYLNEYQKEIERLSR